MASNDGLKEGLEFDILTALCWSPRLCFQIALSITPALFSTPVLRAIAEVAVKFVQDYNAAPGVHLHQLLPARVQREGLALESVLSGMYEQRLLVNEQYIQDEIHNFVSLRKLVNSAQKALDLAGTGNLVQAQEVLRTTYVDEGETKGIWLDDTEAMLGFLDIVDDGCEFPTGINYFDTHGIRPMRKTMFMLMAPAKRGKTWFLIQLGKEAYLHGRKVLHITLENGQDRTAGRYVQSFLGLSQTREDVAWTVPTLSDKEGINFSPERIMHPDNKIKESFTDVGRVELERRLRMITHGSARLTRNRPGRLLIKEFPTGALSYAQLVSYLDMLEHSQDFKPDLLIIDYPDLMATAGRDRRVELGTLFASLRGIAVARDIALAIVTQGNRASEAAGLVRASMVSEDWSKIGTVDTLVTYSQTGAEYDLGIARLYVEAVRNQAGHYIVLVAQDYTTGQFSLDDYYLTKQASDVIKDING